MAAKDGYLTKRDLAQKIYGIEQYIPGDSDTKEISLRATSGTTGNSITLVVVREGRFPEKDSFFTDQLRAYVRLSPPTGALSSVRLALYQSAAKRVMVIDRRDAAKPFIHDLLNQFKPTEMTIIPSALAWVLAGGARENSATWPSKLRRVHLSGDRAHRPSYQPLIDMAADVTVVSDYALVETGFISYSCQHLVERYGDDPIMTFHPMRHVNWLIRDPDPEGVGEIVVFTRELRAGYRTGDMGKMVEEACGCGARRTLFVYGRKDYDVIHCAGVTFIASLVERIFRGFTHTDNAVADYRVEVRERTERNTLRGSVRVLFVPSEESADIESIAHNIQTALMSRLYVTKTKTLGAVVDDGLFDALVVEVVDEIEHGVKIIHLVKK